MKALICDHFGPIDDLYVGELPSKPLKPKEVRVAIKAASLNFSDGLMVEGRYQLKPELPFSPGSNGAGVVLEVGDAVSRVKPGDRVSAGYMYGCLAEELVTEEHWLFPLPDGVSFDQAAVLRIGHGTAAYALYNRGELKAGETLLIFGAAGGVGLAATELGKLAGAKVIACVSTEEKAELARIKGADEVILYTKEDIKDRVMEITGGRGADVILDVVGGETLRKGLSAIAWKGRLLVLGFTSGDIPKIPANLVLVKGCSIVGVFLGAWLSKEPEATLALYDKLHALCAEGKIDAHVSRHIGLSEAKTHLKAFHTRKASGRILVEI